MKAIRSLRNEVYLQYVAVTYPVKSALPSRLREFNRAGMKRNTAHRLCSIRPELMAEGRAMSLSNSSWTFTKTSILHRGGSQCLKF
jgi:hypothetical protein